MKKFLVLFLLLPFFASAQHPYIPIPEDSAVWLVIYKDWHEGESMPPQPPPPPSFDYFPYQTQGKDTVIQGKRYFGLFGNNIPLQDISGVSLYSEALLRQDTVEKKVFYVSNSSSVDQEQILYDFSLQSGDTVTDSNHLWLKPNSLSTGSRSWVQSIDSIFMPDGLWHHRWNFLYYVHPSIPIFPVTAIEGIGYTTGPIMDPSRLYAGILNITSELGCFKVGNRWLYHVPNHWSQSCDSLLARPLWLGTENVLLNPLEQPVLYPNPVSVGGNLILSPMAGPTVKPLCIDAYDALGRLCLRKIISVGEILSLPVNLTAGLYMFRVSDLKTGLLLHHQRLIVQ